MAKRKLDAEEIPAQAAVPERSHLGGLAGLFRWPEHLAARLGALAPHALREIRNKFQRGLFLSSTYSGVGSAEYACALVAAAAAPEDEDADAAACQVQAPGPGLVCMRATDSSPDCRKLLCCDQAKTSCVFGTLEERACPDLVKRLEALQHSYRSQANRDTRPQNQAFKIWGAAFMKEVMDVIRKDAAESGLPSRAWCYKHNHECCFDNKCVDGSWSMEIAGVSCTDFSTLGHRYSWLGATAIPFLLWR